MKRHALNIAIGGYCWLRVPMIAGTLPAWIVGLSFFGSIALIVWGMVGILAEWERRAGLRDGENRKPPLWVTVGTLAAMETVGTLVAGPQLVAMFS